MTFVAGTVLTAAALNSELAAKTDTAMTQNAQTGTSYSYALADASKLLSMSNAASNTVLVTKQATVTWVTGTQLRVVNLGAGVTTLVADTGVTINGNVTLKQYQGGTLIRTASDVWLFVPTASSSGMDLIIPTSVAGTGVTLSGGAVSFSASSTVSVNGCFTGTYDQYMLVAIYTVGADTDMNIRLRLAGSDASAASYTTIILDNSGTTSAARLSSQTATRVGPARNGSRMYSSGLIFAPALAAATGFQMATTSDPVANTINGTFGAATAYDGFTIYPSSSTATGTLRIYGLRN